MAVVDLPKDDQTAHETQVTDYTGAATSATNAAASHATGGFDVVDGPSTNAVDSFMCLPFVLQVAEMFPVEAVRSVAKLNTNYQNANDLCEAVLAYVAADNEEPQTDSQMAATSSNVTESPVGVPKKKRNRRRKNVTEMRPSSSSASESIVDSNNSHQSNTVTKSQANTDMSVPLQLDYDGGMQRSDSLQGLTESDGVKQSQLFGDAGTFRRTASTPNCGLVGQTLASSSRPAHGASNSQQLTPNALASTMQENRTLKSATTCKICGDAQVNTVYLPCGHLICCSGCSQLVSQCSVCHVDVKGTVKVYL